MGSTISDIIIIFDDDIIQIVEETITKHNDSEKPGKFHFTNNG